jgi:hypothetical protein
MRLIQYFVNHFHKGVTIVTILTTQITQQGQAHNTTQSKKTQHNPPNTTPHSAAPKAHSTHLLHQLAISEVEGIPDPGLFRGSGIGHDHDAGVQGEVSDDLHGLLLAHQHADVVSLTMSASGAGMKR